jgi:hypothetical protein
MRKESGRCISALAPHVSEQLFSDIFTRLCEALAAHRVDVRTTAAIGLQLLVRDAADRVPCANLVPLLVKKLEEAIARSEAVLSFSVVLANIIASSRNDAFQPTQTRDVTALSHSFPQYQIVTLCSEDPDVPLTENIILVLLELLLNCTAACAPFIPQVPCASSPSLDADAPMTHPSGHCCRAAEPVFRPQLFGR